MVAFRSRMALIFEPGLCAPTTIRMRVKRLGMSARTNFSVSSSPSPAPVMLSPVVVADMRSAGVGSSFIGSSLPNPRYLTGLSPTKNSAPASMSAGSVSPLLSRCFCFHQPLALPMLLPSPGCATRSQARPTLRISTPSSSLSPSPLVRRCRLLVFCSVISLLPFLLGLHSSEGGVERRYRYTHRVHRFVHHPLQQIGESRLLHTVQRLVECVHPHVGHTHQIQRTVRIRFHAASPSSAPSAPCPTRSNGGTGVLACSASCWPPKTA